MSYEKVGWEDLPSKKTPMNAANLDHMDQGILENSQAIESAQKSLDECLKSVRDGKTTVAAAITDLGVATESDAEFATMAENVTAAGEAQYNAGVTYADGRANASSTNYKTGYNAGVSAAKVGTATADKVLENNTFSSEAGVGIDGGMKDYSTNVQTVTPSASQTGTATIDIADGYHTKIKVNSANVYAAGKTAGEASYKPVTVWTGSQQAEGTVSANLSAYTYVALYFYNFWGQDDICIIMKPGESHSVAVYSDNRTQCAYWRSCAVTTSGITLGAVQEASGASAETNVLILKKVVGLNGTIY